MSYTNELQVIVYGDARAVRTEVEGWKLVVADASDDDVIVLLANEGEIESLPGGKAAFTLWTEASADSEAIDDRLGELFEGARGRGLDCAYSRLGEGGDGLTDESCDDGEAVRCAAWGASNLPIRLPGEDPDKTLHELLKWAIQQCRHAWIDGDEARRSALISRALHAVAGVFGGES